MTALPRLWPQEDGAPVSCREKLRVLEENHTELVQTLRDAFDDAVLMGVDEQAMRRILADAVAGLASVPAVAQSPAQDPPSPGDVPPAARPETPPTPPLSWVPKDIAELQALDKVNARHSVLTVKVGDQVQFGSLRIEVQACVARPPNQPQDAAAFLAITDANNEGVPFRGWMVASQPALSMLQHPVFDIRVTGCRP